ncbi:MAG TPA: hypothetical protein VJT50_12845 [Pyrinomonadaceae bacterium]|nr:hypothetical protein [Pyrinomonadaceae bacterium]
MSASGRMHRGGMNPPHYAEQLYDLLLRGYPAAFRAEYARPMTQLFRDCYRDSSQGRNVSLFWVRLMLDFLRTAPREHWDNFGKEDSKMNNVGRDVIAVVGCIAIIAIAFFLLSYGRKHEAASILSFGYVLDAIVTTGAIGNLVVFVLAKTTRFDSLKVAFWTFLSVNGVPAILLLVLGSRIDPQFRAAATFIGYAASFAFWFGIHWAWSQTKSRMQPAG